MARMLALLFIFSFTLGAGAQAVELRDLAVLVDVDGTETIASVSASAAQARFTPLAGALSAGYTRQVHWLRFTVQAPAAEWWLEVQPPVLDDLRLFEPTATGFTERRAGDRLPFSSREEDYRGFVFKLALPDTAQRTFYLRLQTTSAAIVDLKLWKPSQFHAAKNIEYAALGFYFGIFVLVLMLNLILWFWLRESLYGWFSLYVSSNIALYLGTLGIVAQYLLPEAPLLGDGLAGASVLLFLAASAPFYQRMLRIERNQKFYYGVFKLMLLVPCVSLLSLFTGHFTEAARIAMMFAALSSVMALHIAFRLWRQGQQESVALLLATGLVLVAGMGSALSLLGILRGGMAVLYFQQVSLVFVALAMQVALGVRLTALRKQHRLAQEQANLFDMSGRHERAALEQLVHSLTEKNALLDQVERQNIDLAESEFRLKFAVEGVGDGVWDRNLLTGEVTYSTLWKEMLGYSAEEILPHHQEWESRIHPDDRMAVLASDQAYLEGRAPCYQVEFRMRCKNGHYKWILSRATIASRDEKGAPSRTIGTHTDISTRKQTESALLSTAELLATERVMLADTIESMAQGLLVIGPDQQVQLFNDKVCEMLELPRGLLERKPLLSEVVRFQHERGDFGLDYGWVQPEARDSVAQFGGEIGHNAVRRYVRLTAKGRCLEVQTHKMASGGAVRTFSDFTDLEATKKKAEAANVAKSRFLATMSHEIRTPMNGILGMAQLLLMPNIEAQERLEYAGTIMDSGQTLLALLNNILDFSKIEAGKVELESIALEPALAINETRALYVELARSKGLVIESEWGGPPGARYRGDPHRLRQILSNLVSNAIKFTAQGHVRIEARELGRSAHGAELEFSVSDTGLGIAQDKQTLLFRTFSQVDSSITREYGGSGLGLSIVRSLAELMGGAVGVQSEAGGGSRFWVRIPLGYEEEDVHRPQGSLRTPSYSPTGRITGQLGARVLAVEDNLVNQAVILALLDKLGLRVTLAANGQQAVDAVTAGGVFDLILMDLQMPVMDGCTATERIRFWEAQAGRLRHPIIALTADAFEEDRQRCLRAGMDDYLAKPLAFDSVEAALARWLPPLPLAMAVAPASAQPCLNVARIRARMAEMEPLLAHNKFDAINHFRQLQDDLAGTDLAAEMTETARLLREFRFDLVQQRVSRMVAGQQWKAVIHD